VKKNNVAAKMIFVLVVPMLLTDLPPWPLVGAASAAMSPHWGGSAPLWPLLDAARATTWPLVRASRPTERMGRGWEVRGGEVKAHVWFW